MTEYAHGMTLDNWRRSLQLKVTILRISIDRMRGLLSAKALLDQLPELAAKAAGSPEAEQQVKTIQTELEESLSAELESARLGGKSSLKLETLDEVLEGKAIRSNGEPWPREKKQDFARLIRRIGGFVPSGRDRQTPDVLDFDAQHFERATQLVTGEAAPDSDDERRALERWRAKYGGGDASP